MGPRGPDDNERTHREPAAPVTEPGEELLVLDHAPTRPARRVEDLIVEEVDAETLVYDLRDHRAYCLNPAAAAVWRLADGTRTEAEIRAGLPPASTDVVSADSVRTALRELAKAGLLAEPLPPTPRVSRRELFRRAGAAAAAVPMVTAILVPEAAEAASCLPRGALCQNGSDRRCCGGLSCRRVAGMQIFVCVD